MVISQFLLLIKHFCNIGPPTLDQKRKHNLVDTFSNILLSVHSVSFKTEHKDTFMNLPNVQKQCCVHVLHIN